MDIFRKNCLSSDDVVGFVDITDKQLEEYSVQLLLPEFAKYCLKTATIRKEIIRRSQGAVRANIGQKDLSTVPIVIPPAIDQRMIVLVLDEWEYMIEKTEALIDAKERQFGWLVTRLINKSDRKKKQLSDFITEVSMRNRGNEIDRVLSVTNHSSFVLPEGQLYP